MIGWIAPTFICFQLLVRPAFIAPFLLVTIVALAVSALASPEKLPTESADGSMEMSSMSMRKPVRITGRFRNHQGARAARNRRIRFGEGVLQRRGDQLRQLPRSGKQPPFFQQNRPFGSQDFEVPATTLQRRRNEEPRIGRQENAGKPN